MDQNISEWKCFIGLLQAVEDLVEWPEEEKEPTKYFFCDLPASYTLRRLVRITKCRWKIEQDYTAAHK